LGLLLLAAVLPFFKLSVFTSPMVINAPVSIPGAGFTEPIQPVVEKGFKWLWITLLTFYIAGAVFFFFKLLYSYHLLFRVMLESKKKQLEKGIVLLLSDSAVAPFSWMNYIVISRQDYEENGREILIHEKEHIRLKHSYDLLFVQIYQIFYWFNPAVWLLKRELQVIHEYEADEKVLQTGVDAKKYQLLLIKKAVGSQRFTSMTNSFNHSKIKKRITMMLKRKSNPWSRLKYLCVLPLSAAMVATFAYPAIARAITDVSAVKFSEIIPVTEKSNEQQENKRLTATSGLQTDKPLYLIDDVEVTEAEVDALDITDIVSIDVIKDQSVLLKYYSPYYGTKIKNGLVKIVTGKAIINHPDNHVSNMPERMGMGKALVLLDGKEISYEKMGQLDNEQVDKVMVFTADSPEVKEYGEKAKGGLIMITMKK